MVFWSMLLSWLHFFSLNTLRYFKTKSTSSKEEVWISCTLPQVLTLVKVEMNERKPDHNNQQ